MTTGVTRLASRVLIGLAAVGCGLTPPGSEPLVPIDPLVATPPGALPATPPRPGAIEPLVLPDLSVRELPHDMSLTVATTDRPTSALCVVFRRGGDTMDVRRRWSLEILSTVLSESQGVGGATGRVTTGHMRVCRSGHVRDAVSVARALARVVTAPRWSGDAVDHVRERAETALANQVRSTAYRGVVLAEQQILGTASPEQSSERLAEVSFERLHAELAQPGQVAFVAVGPVDVDALATALGDVLEPWQPVAPGEPAVVEPPGWATYDGADVVVWRGGYRRAHLSVATAAPPADSDDVDAFFVLWHALGGPLTGRLFQALRIGEANAYDIHGIGWLGPERGTFVVGTSVEPEHVDRAVVALRQAVEGVRGGLGAEEIAVGKLHRREALRLGLETTEGLARTLAGLVASRRPISSLRDRDMALAALTPADLRRVAEAYFGRRSPVIVLADDDVVEALLTTEGLNVFDAGSLPGHRAPEVD